MRESLAVVLVVGAVAGCSKPDSGPTKAVASSSSAPSSSPGPSLSAVQAEIRAAEASTPPLEKLTADVRKLLPVLREELAAGKAKARGSDAKCMRDLVTRQTRLRDLRAATLPDIRMWNAWNEPQTYIAGKLDETFGDLQVCVACDESMSPRACTSATKGLAELEKMIK